MPDFVLRLMALEFITVGVILLGITELYVPAAYVHACKGQVDCLAR